MGKVIRGDVWREDIDACQLENRILRTKTDGQATTGLLC